MGKKSKALIAVLVAVVIASALALTACGQEKKDETVTVPNVVSLKHADAEKALSAVGLSFGDIKYEASDTVPKGAVISQDPKALSNVKPDTKVSVVISSGKKAAKDVQVPDLTGKTQADAEKALSDIGLVGVASNPEEAAGAVPGTVFKQATAPGTTVKEGSSVAFTVALAPSMATVPDLSGKTSAEAKDILSKAQLGYDTSVAYSDNVPADKVISQSIPANTSVKSGTTVIITVSLGARPQGDVQVPNVITFSWSDAEAALKSAGLVPRYTGDPSGSIVAQDVAAGTSVAPGTVVTVTMEVPQPHVTVPDFKGMTLSNADAVATGLGLDLDCTGSDGTVIDQWPAAGESVATRTTVHVTLGDNTDKADKSAADNTKSDKAK